MKQVRTTLTKKEKKHIRKWMQKRGMLTTNYWRGCGARPRKSVTESGSTEDLQEPIV